MKEKNEKQIKEISEEQAKKKLEAGYAEAEKLLNDKDKLEETLQKIEKKLETIPKVGNTLSALPIMVSLIKSYIKKEYTEIPVGTIIAVISASVYFLSPIDFIPDTIPGVGYIDDATVIAVCLKLVGTDLEDYKQWRNKNNKK